MVFVDHEKTYDTIPRELIWFYLRNRMVPEQHINIRHVWMLQHQPVAIHFNNGCYSRRHQRGQPMENAICW